MADSRREGERCRELSWSTSFDLFEKMWEDGEEEREMGGERWETMYDYKKITQTNVIHKSPHLNVNWC